MRFTKYSFILLAMGILACIAIPAGTSATTLHETHFRVVVKAEDAKFIGTGVGGAQIVITDRRTGDILIQGQTHGSTDGSSALLAQNRERDAVLTSDETADFEFTLDLFEPVPVTVTATAPLAQTQNLVSASKDMLLLPGKNYADGNAILVEVPGFIVDILLPPAHQKDTLKNGEATFTLSANILKLCGCHITPDSPWPPEKYEVEAAIYKNGTLVTRVPLPYSGTPGIFARPLKFQNAGTYRIDVTAFDPGTKEAGIDSTTFVLAKE